MRALPRVFVAIAAVLSLTTAAADSPGPRVAALTGSPSLAGFVYLLDEGGAEIGTLSFIVQGSGWKGGTTGVHEGAWFESRLVAPGKTQSVAGELEPSALVLTSDGGHLRLPLGDAGTADLEITAVAEPFLPIMCLHMSHGAPTGGSWVASSKMVAPRNGNAEGTVAGYKATGWDPRDEDHLHPPFVWFGRQQLAYVYETPRPPVNPPIGVSVGAGCL